MRLDQSPDSDIGHKKSSDDETGYEASHEQFPYRGTGKTGKHDHDDAWRDQDSQGTSGRDCAHGDVLVIFSLQHGGQGHQAHGDRSGCTHP